MPRSWTLMLFLGLTTGWAYAEAPRSPAAAPAPVALKTTLDQASYAIGVNIGQGIQSEGAEVNVDALLLGLRDALTNVKPRLTEEQMKAAMNAVRAEMESKFTERRKQAGDKNRAEGRAFLADNAKKPGVVTLPSGLQYSVAKKGNGPSPKLTDKGRAHYHGTLIDGTVFDSSVERGEPFVFPVGGVIRGWTEAIQLMKVGDKWRLFIPSELAYGPTGAGGVIGPNAVLVFDVELLGIEGESAAPPR
jgi:FKBP-type peptidyl-prolyl cis-trans isomerase FklB